MATFVTLNMYSYHGVSDCRARFLAQILDEALKEEFKHEEEKSAEQGSEFNKTVTGGEVRGGGY